VLGCEGDLFEIQIDVCRVDALVHFAAFKAVEESLRKPLEYYRNNLDGTVAIGEMMLKHGVHVRSTT
jgi:UDP-glucose 4-epimerase